MRIPRKLAIAAVAASSCIALTCGATGLAGAATESGWIGPTLPSNGIIYLHYSTISNSPLYAETRVYTQLGTVAPAHDMGVQSRLFKSGVMCKINAYVYSPVSTNSFTDRTSGDCGSGSYNSHGFVSVWSGSNYVTYPTFPTNPLNYTAPTVRVADAKFIGRAETGVNGSGQRFGSAATTDDIPDLIASYGTEGQLGYVRNSDLPAPTSRSNNGARGATLIPLYSKDGRTVIGSFSVG